MLRPSPVVGIEIAARRLIAVEVDPSTDPPTVRQAISGEVPAAGLGEWLRARLAEERITARVVHVVLSDPDSIHRVQLLPPMTASERQLSLERELGREIGGNPLVGHQLLRQTEGTPRKDEVLVAATPRREADETLAGLMTARLVPRLVTTAAVALSRVAQILSPASFDRPAAVVHWGFRGLTVAVVDQGTLKFAREVPHLAVPGLDPREWFVTEFQRSIRQYTQTFKGAPIGSVLVGSVETRFEQALADIEARLGLPVANLKDAARALLPQATEAAAALPSGAFLLSLGAAVLAPRETPNLLPRSVVAQRRTALLKRATMAAAFLLVGFLGYSAWGAAREAADYRQALAKVTAQKRSYQAQVAQVDRIKQERETQYQRIRLLKSDPLGGSPLAEVFKEISRVAPRELRLQRLALGRHETGVRVRLTGEVESTDLAQAQSEFNRFYFGLQESPFFYQVIFNPAAASKVTIQQGRSPIIEGRTVRDIQRGAEASQTREAVLGQGKKLVFELELRLRAMSREIK